jgi:hypothetical protein
VRVDNGCRQYCMVDSGEAGYECIKKLFDTYLNDTKPSRPLDVLCSSNRNDTSESGNNDTKLADQGMSKYCRVYD